MQKLPLETQTLYAEFMEQLTALEARRSIGRVPGCFVTKTVKGETYYYFQYSDPGGKQRQTYVGKKSALLDKVVARYQHERKSLKEDSESILRLAALLRTGGALVTDTASARVIKSLAESGVFHLHGVLAGTQAFLVLGNLLGVRWKRGSLRTHDIDIAGDRRVDIAVPNVRADPPKILESLKMGFLPVPPLNPNDPSTSFKVRGRSLRVDLLTPASTSRQKRPVFIQRFHAAAQPLRFLDFLIKDPVPGAVVDGGGILVNVPAPARFAFHKLITSQKRSLVMHDKVEKDLLQAAQILLVMSDERRGDLLLAWEDLRTRGKGWMQLVRAGLDRLKNLHPEAYRALRRAGIRLR